MPDNSSNHRPSLSGGVQLTLDRELIRQIATDVLNAVQDQLDWPSGRLTLTEPEAAEALGVPRHVLRDFRLNGQINSTRIGRKILYTRLQLLNALKASRCNAT